MQRITLGRSGIEVSRIAMGTMTFGGQADERESFRMMDLCVERGIDFFDTANMYNAGASETIIGRWLAKHRGRRERLVLASKVFYPVGDDRSTTGLSRRVILRELDRTLDRLGTDYLDIYYMHAPDHRTAIEESLHTMDVLVRSGRVRTIGMSNYAAWQMAEASWLAAARGWAQPSVAQPMYNMIARAIETEILPCCRHLGMATCVYNPLAGGLLTGKHVKGSDPDPEGRFGSNRFYRERFWHDAHFDAVAALGGVAVESGRTLIGLALRWLLDQEAVSCVLLGASSFAQLETNLAALDERDGTSLDVDTRERCDAIHRELRGFPPKGVVR
ncbi:MAG: aldo/keto reductase [Candidatus Eiseniibacteriota bacterium]|jgi:aryl-alcohol dehydrogenase-like predicted oxidoreductase